MKIAIQAADLDHARIDGTRVYIKNLLKYFGQMDPTSEFLIYHKNNFNPELAPPKFPNYKVIKKAWPIFWTQLRLSSAIWREKPDVLWMPMHNIPYFRSGKLKTVVTIHDLAFKYFPECFTRKELWKLNFLAGLAIGRCDKIITISESSKKDILKFYPHIKEEKIVVIYHGFDQGMFACERNLPAETALKKDLNISGKYILYLGAIQPRKNLAVLISAFEKIKSDRGTADLKLVLAGEKAWLWEDVFKQIEKSPYKKDIITPGRIKFEDIGHLMRGTEIFCFPSLYEGFGIPVLEAYAAGVPVVCADNSSLPEVAGNAALYFSGEDESQLADKLKNILADENLKNDLIAKGKEQIKKFSWEKCAHETLECLKSVAL
ncbi:MAG: glycosyltransferase family 1 protein [Parcubacteria group bacterium]